MASRKTYIILIVIVLIFGISMFLIFGLNNIKKDKYQSVIILGDNTTWVFNDKKWINLRNRTSIDKLNWKKYNVFQDNKEIGDYYLWHDDKWYAFDDKREAVVIDGTLLAYSANYKMDILDFNDTDVLDDTYINEVLKENNISTSSKFTSKYKVSIDFDNDGEEEDFYIISNAFPLDFESDYSFSIAFMVKNNTIYTLYNDVSTISSGLNACKPFYQAFIDTNNDNVHEVILSCGKFSADEQIDMLYQFINGEFKILISNQ